jgi:hypothetical protein
VANELDEVSEEVLELDPTAKLTREQLEGYLWWRYVRSAVFGHCQRR